ncbi:MAG TPA: MASE1 domain-containing protein [Gemmataceae bacterium]|nr:MASE1 domain-containing protein [Gemmataceae bacterium]
MMKAQRSIPLLLAANILLAAAYVAAGKLALSLFAFIHVSASPFWPPTGIALAACLVWGYWLSPGVFIGAFLVNITTKGGVAACLGIAAGNSLEALAAAFLVNRFADGCRAFEHPRGIFRFALLCAGFSTLVSPTIGVSSLYLDGSVEGPAFARVWLTWWQGDALGALVVAPPLILWGTHSNEALRAEISERTRAEERLRQAERLSIVGETMRGLAHESRNALQQSQACLELLGLKSRDQPEIQELVADIQKGLDHVLHLYEEVRRYAAPVQIKRERTDLGELLRTTWEDVARHYTGRKVSFIQESAAVDLHAEIDRCSLSQVFRKILENAATATAGAVEIGATWAEVDRDGSPAVQLRVRDNGPGLTPETQEKLFQPFFTTKTRGTGLGLAIARRIIDAHNGEITVNGEVSDGTEIVITLPRHAS